MEIVTIEKKIFELWQEKFNHFIHRMDALCTPLRRKQDKWLDNCETCRLLNISERKVRNLQSGGRIGFVRCGKKCKYSAQDVSAIIAKGGADIE